MAAGQMVHRPALTCHFGFTLELPLAAWGQLVGSIPLSNDNFLLFAMSYG